ncbi:hypothetical protein BKA56DRAFT_597124 [Ilyonectria sp. MPI-CAGE-AT-0026]|nr:hypothetical protein BKA56DRAFT_597124 [Ilyonectria sp. MPI-CAGE-AT-0026]
MDQGIANLQALVNDVQNWAPDLANPIVLVSGFSGWGEPLFGTINYWGGFENIPAALQNAGYTVIVVRIGPLSSNWERACEVYRQISSGAFDGPNTYPPTAIGIDYGPYYPAMYGYARNGQTKQAVLFGNLPPAWTWTAANPVHFICHSQGGNTIRKLIELMSGAHNVLHPGYFPVGDRRNWITSVTTLGTPHKGTTITDVITPLLPPNPIDMINVITRLVVSASFRQPRFYDLQLDHWGFARQQTPAGVSETFNAMCIRINPRIAIWWGGTGAQPPHNGFYDNSIAGVTQLNIFAPNPAPTIFFFTISFDATVSFPQIDPGPQDSATFPVNPFFTPLQMLLNPGGWPFTGIAWVYQRIRFSPSSTDYARWFVNSLNNHLGPLGYFNRIPLPGSRVPRTDMLPIIMLPALAMGGYYIPGAAGPQSEAFQHNDGVVNTPSMRGPNDAQVREISQFPRNLPTPAAALGAAGPVRYWHFGINETMDHADQIGVFTDPATYNNVENMYLLLANLVTRLI